MIFFYRILSSWWRLFLSMLVAIFLYAYTFINHRDLYLQINDTVTLQTEQVQRAYMSDQTRSWFVLLDISNKLVFMAYVFVARILVAIGGLLIISLPSTLWRLARGEDKVAAVS